MQYALYVYISFQALNTCYGISLLFPTTKLDTCIRKKNVKLIIRFYCQIYV